MVRLRRVVALDSDGQPFDGGRGYKLTLPPDVPAARFWSLTLYDNQTRSMLKTPQRYPRAGSQSYPSPAASADGDGSITVHFSPTRPDGVAEGPHRSPEAVATGHDPGRHRLPDGGEPVRRRPPDR
ncbi:DUF1214 domain-containing protein [Kitasatospora herbaricolor]|uniref:DUF1214 domain-containing protein n=1 Tax=Kitasatospora herbaricolor TaxID=68217 RepID=UPI0036D8468F